jgi:alkanesulfonate monooxygenase SsuD/methylene tetrahydromethanopterin reductase-like flavin-dependent oxidoreductase (luciferase family)
MPYIFEAEITPGMAPREVVALGQLAEEAGFDRLGISCVALWPDTYQLQALVAANTHRIGIGSMVTNPYTRHAAVHAAGWRRWTNSPAAARFAVSESAPGWRRSA